MEKRERFPNTTTMPGAEAETASFQLLECEWWTNSYSCLLRQTLDKRGGTTQRKESSWDLTRAFFLLANISSIGGFFRSPTRLEGRFPIRIQWAGINMIHKRDAHPLSRGAKVKRTDRKDPIPHSSWMAFMDFRLFSASLALRLCWSLSIAGKLSHRDGSKRVKCR